MVEQVSLHTEEATADPKQLPALSAATSEQIMVRMSPQLVTRVDAFAGSLLTRNPGLTVSRADAIRNLVELGLEVGMVDRREEVRSLVGSLTRMSRIEAEMAAEHGAPMYAGVAPSDLGILHGYLARAKELCPGDDSIQGLEPVDPQGLYGQYLNLLQALLDFLITEIEVPRR